MSILVSYLFLCVTSSAFPSVAKCSDAIRYPAVQPTTRTFPVPVLADADVKLFIKSKDGLPVYELQCHPGGFEGDPEFDYSGDFECRLSSVGGHDEYSTLLTEDAHQSRDWESRGRFFASELRDPCSRVAHFGAVRDFRLRGMLLTLEIQDPQFDDATKLKSLTLRVTVVPDPSSCRPIAESVPIPKVGVPAGCKFQEHFVSSASR